MKIVGKRFLCIALSFAILCFSLQSYELESFAAEKTPSDTELETVDLSVDRAEDEPEIDKESAKDIAEYQVEETIENGGTDWDPGIQVRKVYNLYDEQKELCAYAVELKQGSKDAGYVIVGADEEHPPIIEFRTSGRFLDEKLQSEEYLLYDGNINYYKVNENTSQATNIGNEKEKLFVDELDCEGNKTNEAAEEISNEWAAIKEQTGVGSSVPPTSGGVNTNPGAYESGYTSINHATAPDSTLYTYFTMSQFGPGGICVPTAACNLLKYYTDRKRLKSSLLLNNDWNQTFARLKSYFNTSDETGTDMENVKPGLDRYFQDINVQDAITHYYGYGWESDLAEWAEMKRRIDFGEPFIYATSDHYVYEEHAVLAIGYLQYNYGQTQTTGLKTSNYLQVADGWTNLADRYINVNVGNDSYTDEMVTMYFVYTNIQK